MKTRLKFIASLIGVIVSVSLLVVVSYLAENHIIGTLWATVLLALSAVLMLIVLTFAIMADYESGVYECRHCAHIFKPTYKAYLWGAHTIKKRYLRCPKCNKTSWCIRKCSDYGA